MSVNGEIHNAYNLYIIKNTVTIVPRGNLQKKHNSMPCNDCSTWYGVKRNQETAFFCYFSRDLYFLP